MTEWDDDAYYTLACTVLVSWLDRQQKLALLSSAMLLERTHDFSNVSQLVNQDWDSVKPTSFIVLPSPGWTDLRKQVDFPCSPAPPSSTGSTFTLGPALPCPVLHYPALPSPSHPGSASVEGSGSAKPEHQSNRIMRPRSKTNTLSRKPRLKTAAMVSKRCRLPNQEKGKCRQVGGAPTSSCQEAMREVCQGSVNNNKPNKQTKQKQTNLHSRVERSEGKAKGRAKERASAPGFLRNGDSSSENEKQQRKMSHTSLSREERPELSYLHQFCPYQAHTKFCIPCWAPTREERGKHWDVPRRWQTG